MLSNDELKTEQVSTTPLFASALITSLGYVVVQLDVTIVNVALPTFSQVFNAGISSLQWIPDAYVVVFAALLLAAGGLGDRFGNRTVNLLGIGIFLLASLACAFSSSIETMIFGRLLQGLGAALIVPSSLALLSFACGNNPLLRAKAIGWWSAMGGIISAAGPFIGAIVLTHISWHALFLINIPICAAGLILTFFYIPESTAHNSLNIDTKGILLFVIACFSMIYVMIQFGKSFSVSRDEILFFGLFVLALLFLIVHLAKSKYAFLPVSLLKKPAFSLSLLLAAAMNFSFYGSLFLLTVYFQVYRGFTPVMTGLALLTFTVIAFANTLSGYLATRFGPRFTLTLGILLASLNYFILATLTYLDAAFSTFVCFLFLMPIGGGIATPTLLSTFLHQAPAGKTATASAAINTMRQTGSAIGVALLGLLVTGIHFPVGIGATIGFVTAALMMLGGALLVSRLA